MLFEKSDGHDICRYNLSQAVLEHNTARRTIVVITVWVDRQMDRADALPGTSNHQLAP